MAKATPLRRPWPPDGATRLGRLRQWSSSCAPRARTLSAKGGRRSCSRERHALQEAERTIDRGSPRPGAASAADLIEGGCAATGAGRRDRRPGPSWFAPTRRRRRAVREPEVRLGGLAEAPSANNRRDQLRARRENRVDPGEVQPRPYPHGGCTALLFPRSGPAAFRPLVGCDEIAVGFSSPEPVVSFGGFVARDLPTGEQCPIGAPRPKTQAAVNTADGRLHRSLLSFKGRPR
jgi:hypothetical protein